MTGLAMILLALGVASVIAAWLLSRTTGVRSDVTVIATDAGYLAPETLEDPVLQIRGRPDYLVRVDSGVAPVELKSGKSPRSGRPYDGHLFQLVAYCLLVEDVCQAFVPYGVVQYEDRSIRVEYTSSLRRGLLVLLEEIRTAKRGGEFHIDHDCPGKCGSCGFREVCGEILI